MNRNDVVIGVIGVDHRHIYGMLDNMLAAGATAKGWWTEGEPAPLAGFLKRFPDLPRRADRRALLDDPTINLVLIAAPPHQRAALAIEAMEAGKDVMLDKPGCITVEELRAIQASIERTKRIWSVDFSERFEVPAAVKALEMVRAGAVGSVVQTLAVGPHRLNRHTRPDWFFDKRLYGGILGDIGTHQIDQFLAFTNSSTAEIVTASTANYANPEDPHFEDFGELMLRSDHARGYARVDWYTPDALPNWGDGRLTILGTEGYIELRKYVDVEGRPGTDHLFYVSNNRSEYLDCSTVPLTYFADLAADILDRGERAMSSAYALEVTRLAIAAQHMAEREKGHTAR